MESTNQTSENSIPLNPIQEEPTSLNPIQEESTPLNPIQEEPTSENRISEIETLEIQTTPIQTLEKQITLKCWNGNISFTPPLKFWDYAEDTIFGSSFKCDSYTLETSKELAMELVIPIFYFEAFKYTKSIYFTLEAWAGASKLWSSALNRKTFLGSIFALNSNKPFNNFINLYFYRDIIYSEINENGEEKETTDYILTSRYFRFLYQHQPYPELQIEELDSKQPIENWFHYNNDKNEYKYDLVKNRVIGLKDKTLATAVTHDKIKYSNEKLKNNEFEQFYAEIKNKMLEIYTDGLNEESKKFLEKCWL